MSFTTKIDTTGIFPVIHLMDEAQKTSIEIYGFGALLNAFSIDNSVNIIDGFASPQDAVNNITKGFKSAKLSPFVCRIFNGKYVFDEQEYKVGKFYIGEESIHGLLYDEIFTIINSGANDIAAFATLQYEYAKKDKGFPFSYTCTVNYSLEKNNSLSIKTSVKNNSDIKMPVCDGWHPYFTLGANINELFLEMNVKKMLEFNERLVPTGNIISYKKFQRSEIIGETFLDNCFLLNDHNKPACILRNNKSGLELTIQPDKSYPYLQVYTPPHRNSIAIENLSAAPDAFNNKIGLTILNPGESCSFKTVYSASVKL